MQHYGPTALRIVAGIVFAAHGAQKLFGLFGGSGLSGAADVFAALGLRPPLPIALGSGIVELAGGLLLVAGAWTRWAGVALLADLALVIWTAHLPHGFFLNWRLRPGIGHGVEFHLLLVGALVCLLLTGPGAFSIDGWRARAAELAAAGRARLRAGNV
jgi:putative oxidoreductase